MQRLYCSGLTHELEVFNKVHTKPITMPLHKKIHLFKTINKTLPHNESEILKFN